MLSQSVEEVVFIQISVGQVLSQSVEEVVFIQILLHMCTYVRIRSFVQCDPFNMGMSCLIVVLLNSTPE